MQRFLGVAVQALVLDGRATVRVAERFDYSTIEQVDRVVGVLRSQGRDELADGIARAFAAARRHALAPAPAQPTTVARPSKPRTRFARTDGRPEFWSGYRDPVVGMTLYS